MNTNHNKLWQFRQRLFVTGVVLFMTLVTIQTGRSQSNHASSQFESPLPTPVVSQYKRVAIQYLG